MLIVCPSCASRYELDEAKVGPSGRKVRCASCQTAWQVEAPAPAAPPAPETAEPEQAGSQPVTGEVAEQEFPSAPSEDETNALLAEELRRAAAIEESVSTLAAERDEAEAVPPAQPLRPVRRAKPVARRWMAALRPPSRLPLGTPAAILLAGLSLLGLVLWQRDAVVRTMPQFAALYEKLGMPVNLRGLAFSAVESELVQDAQGRFLVVEGDVTNIARTRTKLPPITVAVKDEAGQVLYTWTAEPPRPMLEPAELVRFRARLAAPPENGRSVHVRFGETPQATLANAS